MDTYSTAIIDAVEKVRTAVLKLRYIKRKKTKKYKI